MSYHNAREERFEHRRNLVNGMQWFVPILHVWLTPSQKEQKTLSVRTRGDKSNWMHGHAGEQTLHMLCTRMFGTRQTPLAGLPWACRTCFPLCKDRTRQRKIGEADFIPALSKLAYYVSVNNKIHFFNSLLIYNMGMKTK